MSDNKTKTVLSEKFKEKVISKLPDDFDFASIGKIDLREAEKIANEEIVFLSEEDLIDGLEEFELIPVKVPEKNKLITTEVVSEQKNIEKVIIKEVSDSEKLYEKEEVLFEEFKNIEIPDKNAQVKLKIHDITPEIEKEEPVLETTNEEIKISEPVLSEKDSTTIVKEEPIDYLAEDDSSIIEINLDEELKPEQEIIESVNETQILKQKIDEDQFNNQLDDIVRSDEDEEPEFIPGIYDEPSLKSNVQFIDDSHVEKKEKEIMAVYESDPLTENLVKMVDISEGTLIVFNETAEVNSRIEYLLDNRQSYEAENLSLLFKQETFEDDTDFDFIDNAIVRDDYSVYIQEIDDFLRSRESQSESQISEILGLLPEENEFIEERLFGEYYREFEDELDLEFINPELSFFDRGYVQKKELNYFLYDKNSLLDEEKKSIEDDITSESAIIFEENISDIERLLKESSFESIEDIIENEIIESISEESVIPDISDSIIILEDVEEIERVTSQFPDKKTELKKLLSYLDGLMEKLPEESIKKFAESEYYELYVKVLKEIGI